MCRGSFAALTTQFQTSCWCRTIICMEWWEEGGDAVILICCQVWPFHTDRVRFFPFPILSNIYCPIFCLVTSIEFKGLWAWSTEYLFKTIKLNFYLWQIWSLSTCPHYSVLKTPDLSINKLGYLVYWHTIVLSQVTHPLLIYQFGDGTELMLLAKSYSSSTSSAPCSFHILQKFYISPEFLWFWSLTTGLCNLPTFFD